MGKKTVAMEAKNFSVETVKKALFVKAAVVTKFPAMIVRATKPKAVLRAMDSVLVSGEFSELDMTVLYKEIS